METKTIFLTLAFERIDETSIVDRGIGLVTHSDFCHTEMILENEWIYARQTGIGKKPVKPLDFDKWEYYELSLETTESILTGVRRHIQNDIIGSKYDFLGILFSQLFRFKLQSRQRWFCSELVTYILQRLNVDFLYNIHPSELSPEDLRKILLREMELGNQKIKIRRINI